ncbi:erythromycin esterase family protein [Streptomyces sp. NPDC006512]|uniref:erythromycin esterase family protein n=1 Tax=Streptomyces sp. NPDC006512 TaxID=3154307 RepID=UPI0033B3D086
MTQDIRDFVTPSCELLALGEPTHRARAFAWIRNALFAQLAGHGFRSIALETDRVTALAVDDFVRNGAGTLDSAMGTGFSHGLGELDANRQLIAWMRAHNEDRPARERLAFHGFDVPTEMTGAPSPRPYLAHARDYLGLDTDLAALAGDDERWSRPEAVLDPAVSMGATAGAERLRSVAYDMLDSLHARAAELVPATSRAAWFRAEAHLTTGLGLLRYHRESARPGDRTERFSRQLATRDALMARNLLAVRNVEAGRGATLVFAHSLHLQRNPSRWPLPETDLAWSGAGAIVGSLLGERYAYVAGGLGRSEAIGLPEPRPDTHEGLLQRRVTGWGLVPADAAGPARTRTDTTPQQGYAPLDRETLGAADAVLHVGADADRGALPGT